MRVRDVLDTREARVEAAEGVWRILGHTPSLMFLETRKYGQELPSRLVRSSYAAYAGGMGGVGMGGHTPCTPGQDPAARIGGGEGIARRMRAVLQSGPSDSHPDEGMGTQQQLRYQVDRLVFELGLSTIFTTATTASGSRMATVARTMSRRTGSLPSQRFLRQHFRGARD